VYSVKLEEFVLLDEKSKNCLEKGEAKRKNEKIDECSEKIAVSYMRGVN